MQIEKLQHAQVAGNDNGEVMSKANKRCCHSLIKKLQCQNWQHINYKSQQS